MYMSMYVTSAAVSTRRIVYETRVFQAEDFFKAKRRILKHLRFACVGSYGVGVSVKR
jgi:hypothetical protein